MRNSTVDREEQFEDLVRRYSRPVIAFCLRRSTHVDAHDAAADVFAIAWRRFDDIPGDDRTLCWLFGVARRVLANQQRSRHRRTRLREKMGAMVQSPIAGPEAVVVRSDTDQEVIDALHRLEPRDQEVLALLVWDEVSRSDAARILDISLEALHKRFQRALRRLEHELPRSRKHTTNPPSIERGVAR